MINTKNNFSALDHFVHLFSRAVSPSAFGNGARLSRVRMHHIVNWATPTRPRDIVVPPYASFVNLVVAGMLLGWMVSRYALIKLPNAHRNRSIIGPVNSSEAEIFREYL